MTVEMSVELAKDGDFVILDKKAGLVLFGGNWTPTGAWARRNGRRGPTPPPPATAGCIYIG